ncbi:MFS transporter [Celerinatantimonas diazotrophica]|uniref:Putative MFS family arabinose efflux permease n=1 Tax=Celerinatantimonas diazotrophica TaxID=412034 RepID=A0A4R1JBP7_9GAMM|nr:MFS transporter [Celerinatantimonas diazotrophica]TCK47579.1 putative MFS family arabinose efflux permease [Celerinatantimonas diazotrophica]CAG9296798.1 hypothetical protein CEDIAZO_01956 [Celerinatantimonas diazotrophica]
MVRSKLSLNSTLAMAVLSFALFLVYVTANAPTPLYTLWQQHISYNTTGIGIIFVAYHIGIAISLLSLTRVQNATTIKRLLLLALVGTIFAGALFSSAEHFWQLVTARLIIGLCCGTFVSCGISLIVKIGLQQQVHNTPLIVTLACVLGFGIGPFYAGVLADLIHPPYSSIFTPLMILLTICVVILARMQPEKELVELGHHEANGPVEEGKKSYGLTFVTVGLFASPFAIAGLFISIGPKIITTLMHTDSHTIVGGIALLMFGAGIISQLCLKNLSIGKQVLVGTVCASIGGVSILIAEVWHSAAIMAIASIFAGVGQSMTQLSGTRVLKQHLPMGTFQRSTATFFLGGYLFAAISIFFLGFLASHLGLQTATQVFLYFCFMLLGASFGGYVILHQEPAKA